jgi:predicted ATPase
LVDEAFNADAKLFWNSNHSVEELQREANYGQRFMSRLCSMSPDKELPRNMPDLRVVG